MHAALAHALAGELDTVGVVDPAIEDRVGTARESAVAVDADRHPSYGPNGGVADTFENAKATFRRTWDAYGGYLKARVADLRVQTKSFTNGWLAAGTDDASANCVARSLRRTRPERRGRIYRSGPSRCRHDQAEGSCIPVHRQTKVLIALPCLTP